MRERDKFKEITADNAALKDKLAKIEIDSLVKEAELTPEWTQSLTGKIQEEIKAEIFKL